MSRSAVTTGVLSRCTRLILVFAMALGLILPHQHDAAAAHAHGLPSAHGVDVASSGSGHDHGPVSPESGPKADCCLHHAPCCALPAAAMRMTVPPVRPGNMAPPASLPVLIDPLLDRLERPPRSAV